MVSRRLFGLALSALLLAACPSEKAVTEAIIVIDSDLAVPDSLDELVIEVSGPEGRMESATATLGGEQAPLPRTLTLVQGSGPTGPYTVVARGRQGGGDVVSRTARFSFVPEESVVILMHLVEACIGQDCGANQTCTERGCQSVDRSDLFVWTGVPPRLGETPDAGLPDAGTPDDGSVPTDACTEELCNDADDDCDGEVDEGFDLATDPFNCGGCGNLCVFRNGDGECTGGECVVTACDPGFDDCVAGNDGCETDVRMDEANCGACGNACSPPRDICCNSECRPNCN
ncbi:MAG TPA: hypothetical protein RMH85_14305 [Polyangiaceae bacterium LLY-WYZ-15_(1-7)]|nr:hypothetical protein [Myxococcales bacterium]MAT26721.1 hypothetical protein [Sandaracinus sp.]HJK94697.1 hypothetical protein [Polyangiaceae bacterium LLY-WYZ-15_(1-7)]MBJ72304.1 hypothetical protein [Sandaracinus sp.]HJL04670.1 hypothetical protein [Polyangiaceae bacterium LLY-WYZ-15_(1-7)]